jgi:hypothetical protein
MRTKDGPARVLTLLAVAVILMTVCVGCSSTAGQRQWGACAGIGAVAGAFAGGGTGVGLAIYTRGSHRGLGNPEEGELYRWGLSGGAIGAILGAGIGHELCDPEAEPRSVTYYSSSSSSSYTGTTTVPPPPNP